MYNQSDVRLIKAHTNLNVPKGDGPLNLNVPKGDEISSVFISDSMHFDLGNISKYKLGRFRLVLCIIGFLSLRDRITSLVMNSFEVAVTPKNGTFGNHSRSSINLPYLGRKSCPQDETQCASSIATKHIRTSVCNFSINCAPRLIQSSGVM